MSTKVSVASSKWSERINFFFRNKRFEHGVAHVRRYIKPPREVLCSFTGENVLRRCRNLVLKVLSRQTVGRQCLPWPNKDGSVGSKGSLTKNTYRVTYKSKPKGPSFPEIPWPELHSPTGCLVGGPRGSQTKNTYRDTKNSESEGLAFLEVQRFGCPSFTYYRVCTCPAEIDRELNRERPTKTYGDTEITKQKRLPLASAPPSFTQHRVYPRSAEITRELNREQLKNSHGDTEITKQKRLLLASAPPSFTYHRVNPLSAEITWELNREQLKNSHGDTELIKQKRLPLASAPPILRKHCHLLTKPAQHKSKLKLNPNLVMADKLGGVQGIRTHRDTKSLAYIFLAPMILSLCFSLRQSMKTEIVHMFCMGASGFISGDYKRKFRTQTKLNKVKERKLGFREKIANKRLNYLTRRTPWADTNEPGHNLLTDVEG